MAGTAALQLDPVAALHGDREFLPAAAWGGLDRGDPLHRYMTEIFMDLVKHRIGAPDMQGTGREPEHYRGVERYVGLLCDLARRRPGRGTRDEVVTERG